MSPNSTPQANGFLKLMVIGNSFAQEIPLNPIKTLFMPGQIYAFVVDIPIPYNAIVQVRIKYDRAGPYDALGIVMNRLSLQQQGVQYPSLYCGIFPQVLSTASWTPLTRPCPV